MLKIARGLIATSILSLLFFTILPFRFEHTSVNCAGGQSSCNGYNITESTGHPWYWFGGYHLFFEQQSPDMYQRESRSSQYQYSSRLEIVFLAFASIGLGIVSYVVALFICSKKQRRP